MSQRKALYKLLPEEREIFKLSSKEPNIFTDFYMRSEHSGTWYLPGAQTEQWSKAYESLLSAWRDQRRPDTILLGNLKYEVRWEHERSDEYQRLPAFFRNHGALFLPYIRNLITDKHTIRTIIGGYGSGKSMGMVMVDLFRAATLPGFKGLMIAPTSTQALELQTIAMTLISGTPYEERFLISYREKPFPNLIIGNDEVGRNSIEFFPMDGSVRTNSSKFLSLTRDSAVIDQAEKFHDLRSIVSDLGSRMRGRVARTGRGRIGTITFLANAAENQQLWEYFDMAEEDSKNYFSLQPSSYDNIFLTDADLARFELTSGYSEEIRLQNLFGKRPLGDGKEFPRFLLEAMRTPGLDDIMNNGISEEDKRAEENPDYVRKFIKKQARRVGVYEWLLPPMKGHKYMVMSDPGTKDPPNRDSAVIMVWDITNFPGHRDDPYPAVLVGFVWVYGGGSINTWATRFMEIVRHYNAILQCGFDATAYQSGYEQWIPILGDLYPEKVNLAGNGKFLCLNAAKVLTSRQMIQTPAEITGLYSQLALYEYPESKTSPQQDITMCFIMSCWWLQRMFLYLESEFENRPDYDHLDRYSRPMADRNALHSREGREAAIVRTETPVDRGRVSFTPFDSRGRQADAWYERLPKSKTDDPDYR
jgi:hypothetical protein